MSDEDNFGGSLVLDVKLTWRSVFFINLLFLGCTVTQLEK